MMKRLLGMIAVLASTALAGPNSGAVVRVDMTPATFGQSAVSATVTGLTANAQFDVLVVTDHVVNLDTYTFRVAFDSTKARFVAADYSYGATGNILASGGGTTVGISPRLRHGVGTPIDTVEFAYTMTGSDPSVAPDGFGLLGYIRFQSRLAALDSAVIRPIRAELLDVNSVKDVVVSDSLVQGKHYFVPQYAITASAGTGGTITPSGTVNVNHGSNRSFTIAASTGYQITNVLVDGASVGAVASYTFSNVTVGHTIAASFTLTTYRLTLTNDGHGLTTPSTYVDVAPGGVVSISAAASATYHFSQWTTTSGGPITIQDQYASTTSVTVNGNATIRADFVLGGSLNVTVLNSSGTVYVNAFAASGWVGQRKITGTTGTIGDLAPGGYLMTVVNQGKRIEYRDTIVYANQATSVTISLRNSIPVAFDTLVELSAGGTPISTGGLSSAVQEDFDRDGDADLLIGKADGSFSYYRKDAPGFVAATAPRHASGSSLSDANGILCLRIVDWNGDNRFDLLTSNSLNQVRLFSNISGRGELVFDAGTTVYTAAAGMTGFDVSEVDGDGYPDVIAGYADGTVRVALSATTFTWAAPAWQAATALTISGGAGIDVGNDAMPCVMDMSGDGIQDLLIGSRDGSVQYFQKRTDGAYRSRGLAAWLGRPMQFSGGSAAAAQYGETGELPGLLLSDKDGQVYATSGALRGDFNGDGSVEIEDLAIFGDTWLRTEGGLGWVSRCNLDLTPDGSGVQVIDIMDLSVFGDSWLTEK